MGVMRSLMMVLGMRMGIRSIGGDHGWIRRMRRLPMFVCFYSSRESGADVDASDGERKYGLLNGPTDSEKRLPSVRCKSECGSWKV